MGMLDDVLEAAKSRLTGAGEQGGMLDGLVGMISDSKGGGLAGLVEQFKGKGLGDVVSSWVGTGQNLPISGDQIRDVLGAENLQQMAQQAGIKPEAAADQLANLLPQVVDRLTPEGKVPEGNLLDQGLNLIKGKLFG